MIIRLQFKDPDCFVTADGNETDGLHTLPQREQDKVAKFVEWSEYVTVEIDTKTGKAKVIPVED
jgi:hypothetical protein